MEHFNKIMRIVETAQKIKNWTADTCSRCGHTKSGQSDGMLYDELCREVEAYELALKTSLKLEKEN